MNEVLIVSRAVHFGSCLVLLGVFAVWLLIERPGAGRRGMGWRLAAVCLAAAMGSGLLWLWAAAAGMSGSSMMESLNPQLFELVLGQTPPGHVWIFRSVVAGLIAAAICFRRGRGIVGIVLVAVFVGSLAWLGHAGAGEGMRRVEMLTADVAHLLAAGVWPGGLLPMALVLRRGMRVGELAEARAGARRFSAMSLAAVGVLAGSGVTNACFLVGSFHALVGTDYGRLLMVKVTLFAAAAGLGACNLLIHKPGLDAAPEALGAMARKVWMEAGLGALIVLVVAVMGTLPPGAQP
ncbi:MAG: CopD family protein [Chthoniobacteraceae bacterium]|jgi:putative copper resistance protein D